MTWFVFEHFCNNCHQVNLEPCHNFCFSKLTGYQSFIHHKQLTGQTSFTLAANHFHFTLRHDFFAKEQKQNQFIFLHTSCLISKWKSFWTKKYWVDLLFLWCETISNDSFLLQNTVIVSPTFEFECTDKGIYEHDSDCARFWLCKAQNGEPELYKCPAGYLFNDEKRRCVKEEEVACDKVPDFSRIAYEPQPIQLQVSQLDTFFNKWANY